MRKKGLDNKREGGVDGTEEIPSFLTFHYSKYMIQTLLYSLLASQFH